MVPREKMRGIDKRQETIETNRTVGDKLRCIKAKPDKQRGLSGLGCIEMGGRVVRNAGGTLRARSIVLAVAVVIAGNGLYVVDLVHDPAIHIVEHGGVDFVSAGVLPEIDAHARDVKQSQVVADLLFGVFFAVTPSGKKDFHAAEFWELSKRPHRVGQAAADGQHSSKAARVVECDSQGHCAAAIIAGQVDPLRGDVQPTLSNADAAEDPIFGLGNVSWLLGPGETALASGSRAAWAYGCIVAHAYQWQDAIELAFVIVGAMQPDDQGVGVIALVVLRGEEAVGLFVAARRVGGEGVGGWARIERARYRGSHGPDFRIVVEQVVNAVHCVFASG